MGQAANATEWALSFYNLHDSVKLRALKTERIGTLSCITGVVTRTSEVRPELVMGHFTCLECFTEQDPQEQQFKYTEPIMCKNPVRSRAFSRCTLGRHLFVCTLFSQCSLLSDADPRTAPQITLSCLHPSECLTS